MKTNRFILAASIGLALAFTFSCSGDDSVDYPSDGNVSNPGGGIVYGSPVIYEGKTYKTVVIGAQTWMAENLNYAVENSECYDYNESNCDKYGRFYDWVTAMALPSYCDISFCEDQINSPHRGICPSGWHIPSDAEWDKLMRYADDTNGMDPYNRNTAGKHLKATSGWNDYNEESGNGLDTYGFSALPCGYGYTSGGFRYGGDGGYWWSASKYDPLSSDAYYWYMNLGEEVYSTAYSKSDFLSVRCVKD